MGNKLCKKKQDGSCTVDNSAKSPRSLDKIINRLHLRPNSWKSDSHLNHQKQVNRYNMDPSIEKADQKNLIIDTTAKKGFSKSTDWTDTTLEVPDKDEEPIHLHNPKLSLIFDNEKSPAAAPVPPPRKHKKNLREKIEAVAKSSLQAFQPKKPVEEPLAVKRTVNPTCPVDDHDCAIHNRDHKHELRKNELNARNIEHQKQLQQNPAKGSVKLSSKEAKRRKNLSVISLPNYNELKLAVATFDDIDKKPGGDQPHQASSADDDGPSSLTSLPNDGHRKLTSTASSGKLETCMTRCRSFGSLLPQQLLEKWRVARKVPGQDIESDDSFGALEDWDLRIIEHYNPKDASLPRSRKIIRKDEKSVLADLENLIVSEEEAQKPVAPVRKSESLLKKINREGSQSAATRRSLERDQSIKPSKNDTPLSITPPPSPPSPPNNAEQERLIPKITSLPTEENGVPEHSSLMKILEKYSMMDKQQKVVDDKITVQEEKITPKVLKSQQISQLKPEPDNNVDSSNCKNLLTDKTKKDIACVESFINYEKSHFSGEQF